MTKTKKKSGTRRLDFVVPDEVARTLDLYVERLSKKTGFPVSRTQAFIGLVEATKKGDGQ